MSDPKQLDELHNRLEASVKQALADGDYVLAARCALVIDAVRKWGDSGFQGPPPPDARELSGVDLMRLETGLSSLQDIDESLLTDLVSDESEDAGQFSEALEVQFERAERSLDSHHVVEAIADLDVVIQRAFALQAKAQRALVRAQRIWQEKLNQAIAQARKHGRSQRRDFKGRRAQWEAVLALDPDNQEALEAIREIETAEFEQSLRSTIDELRKPLQKRDKRITDVEAARNKASELLTGGQLRDPGLIAEVQDVYNQLDELRDQILRAVEGARGSESAGDFKRAMRIFRDALLQGFTEVVDDRDGAPTDVVEGLKRNRLAYFEELKKRSAQRYGDAKANLAAGAPEAALRWLKEAQELLGEVEEGGEELRRDIGVLMDRVDFEVDQKQGAERLVLDAQKHDDPAEARLLLMRAKQLYPAYPDIDHLIEGKETLVMFKTISDVTQDLISAELALNARRFPEARHHCNQALSRGLSLEASNDELRAKRLETEEMLKVIGEREKNLTDLLNKMAKIDQSLERGDLRVAQRMFDLLTPEERSSPEGLERLARLQLAHEDAQSGEVKRAEQEIPSPASSG